MEPKRYPLKEVTLEVAAGTAIAHSMLLNALIATHPDLAALRSAWQTETAEKRSTKPNPATPADYCLTRIREIDELLGA